MQVNIKHLQEKKLIGKCLKMSVAHNRTAELWSGFMPHRKEIENNCNNNLFSLQIYPDDYFTAFNLKKEFEKWALVEVKDFANVPEKMETFVLPGGLYAVFEYKGSSANNSVFQTILKSWLPNSDYQLDSRPHFEILGEKYKNNDPNSEEEIWIPIVKNK